MPRLFLAILIVASAALAIAFVASRAARLFASNETEGLINSRSSMQKLSFFLLLCLMIYVSFSGAS